MEMTEKSPVTSAGEEMDAVSSPDSDKRLFEREKDNLNG